MRRFPIDETTVERLLSGSLHPNDAPPQFAGIAGVIQRVNASAAGTELSSHAATVSAMGEAIRSGIDSGSQITTRPLGGRKSMFGRFFTLKAAGIAIPVLALTAGVAAASAGSLPGSAQSDVSRALSHIGISVPNPNQSKAPSGSSSSGSNGPGATQSRTASGPQIPGNELYGLCTAYLAHQGTTSTTTSTSNPGTGTGVGASAGTGTGSSTTGTGSSTASGSGTGSTRRAAASSAAAANTGRWSSSVAFSNLEAAAKAKGETVAAYCQGVKPPGATSSTTTTTTGSGSTGSGSTNAGSHRAGGSGAQGGPGASGGGGNGHAPRTGPPSSPPSAGNRLIPTSVPPAGPRAK
ncbi:MAG: hypothetical protein M1134_06970 [Actinobacteria bacterium]|nr:hypothetical protein [Actinomycetota bacterium]